MHVLLDVETRALIPVEIMNLIVLMNAMSMALKLLFVVAKNVFQKQQ